MTMVKRLLVIMLAFAIFANLIACSKNETTPQNSTKDSSTADSQKPSSEKSEQPTSTSDNSGDKDGKGMVIDFWMTFGQGSVNNEILMKQVNDFNELNKGKIYVEATYQGNYADCLSKYITSYAAGETPVVGVCDAPDTPQIIDMGLIQNLTPLIERDNVDIDDYIEGFLSYSRKDGDIYAMPFCRSTPVLYYNKDLFKKALGHDNAPVTWDDLLNYGKGIQEYAKKENIQGMWGISIDIASWYIGAFITQLGGDLISEDGRKGMFTKDQVGLKALQFWRSLVDEGIYYVPGSTSSNAREEFIVGNIGMYMTSTGNMGTITKNAQFDVGVTYLPKNVRYAIQTGGGNVVIFNDATKEETDAGWEFIKYLTSAEVNAEFSMVSGYCLTHKSAENLESVQKFWKENPTFKVAYDQLEHVKETYVSPYWAECNLATVNILERLLQDQSITPEQAYEELINAYEDILPDGCYKE